MYNVSLLLLRFVRLVIIMHLNVNERIYAMEQKQLKYFRKIKKLSANLLIKNDSNNNFMLF